MEKRIFKNAAVTQSDLEAISTADLLSVFNANTAILGGQPIAKFSDRKSALRRTWASMEIVSQQLPELPQEITIDVDDDDNFPAPPVSAPPVSDVPMVTCRMCGELKPKKSCFELHGEYICKNEKDCKKPSTLLKQVAVATARITEAKTAKTKKEPKAKKPSEVGKFDACALVALENKRASATSVRSVVYNHIAANSGTTIEQMVAESVATLPVVRDCVKKLFADGKISITGWKVDVPRTLQFSRI